MRPVLLCMVAFFFSVLVGCGSSGGGSGDDGLAETVGDGAGNDVGLALTDNPIVKTQIFGQNGNLYKPKADEHSAGAGNMVVLLSGKFKTMFDSCEIRTASGEIAQLNCIRAPWTQFPNTCFSNPDGIGPRQTWRANFGCNSVGEVKVTCRDAQQEVIFTAPAGQRGNVCSRFG